jgi:hypothetical protein
MYAHIYSRITAGNSDLCTFHVGTIKWIGKHVSTATYTHNTVEELVQLMQGQ